MRATGLRWEGESEDELTEEMVVAHVGIKGEKGKVIDQVDRVEGGTLLNDEEKGIGEVSSRSMKEVEKRPVRRLWSVMK